MSSTAHAPPRDWDEVALLDVADIPNGQVDPRVRPFNLMPLVAPNHIESGSGRVLGPVPSAQEQGAISGKYEFREGDVVYSKIRPYLRKAMLAKAPGLCSADMYPLRPNEGLDSGFLLAVLLSERFTEFASSVSMRTGIPKINRKELAQYTLSLPPLPEQRKIAAILSSVDDAIEETQAVIDQLAVVKQAMMAELLTRGLPGRHKRFKQTEIGEIPEGWEVVHGERLFKLFGGYGPSSVEFADDGDTLFVKVADLNHPSNSVEMHTSELRFHAAENPRIRAYGEGHLLFPKRGAAIFKNRVRLLVRPTSVDPNLMVLRPSGSIHAPFLMYYLLYFGLFNLSDNSGVPQLNNKHLYPHLFPCPPMAEQEEIAKAMAVVEERRVAEQGKLVGLEQTKAALMNVLLTGELRVTPDEEAA